MSKEMQLLESKMAFYKRMINELDVLNYVTGPNKYYSEEIEDYQDKLEEIYVRYRELKRSNNLWPIKFFIAFTKQKDYMIAGCGQY